MKRHYARGCYHIHDYEAALQYLHNVRAKVAWILARCISSGLTHLQEK